MEGPVVGAVTTIEKGWKVNAGYITGLFSKSSNDLQAEINRLIEEESSLEAELSKLTAANHNRLLQSVLNFSIIETNVNGINELVKTAVGQTDVHCVEKTLKECQQRVEASLKVAANELSNVDVVELERFFLLPTLMEISWRERNWGELLKLAGEHDIIANSSALKSLRSSVRVSVHCLEWIERSIRLMIESITTDSTQTYDNILMILLELLIRTRPNISTDLALIKVPESVVEKLSDDEKLHWTNLLMIECFIFKLKEVEMNNKSYNNLNPLRPQSTFENYISSIVALTELFEQRLNQSKSLPTSINDSLEISRNKSVSKYVQIITSSISYHIKSIQYDCYLNYSSTVDDWLELDFSEFNTIQHLLDNTTQEPTTNDNLLPQLSTLTKWLRELTRLNNTLKRLQADAVSIIVDPITDLCERKICSNLRIIGSQLIIDFKEEPSHHNNIISTQNDIQQKELSPIEIIEECQRIVSDYNITPLIYWLSSHLSLLNECRDIILALGQDGVHHFAHTLMNCICWSCYHLMSELHRQYGRSSEIAVNGRRLMGVAWNMVVKCVVLAMAVMLGYCRPSMKLEKSDWMDGVELAPSSFFSMLVSERRMVGDSRLLSLDALCRQLQ